MAKLKTIDRNYLRNILENFDLLQEKDVRVAYLNKLDLSNFVPRLKISEQRPMIFADHMITTLEQSSIDDEEALFVFLDRVKQDVSPEVRKEFERIIKDYSSITPYSVVDADDNWGQTKIEDSTLEKVWGEGTLLRHIAFLQRAIDVAASVAHIEISGTSQGTGFLISPTMLITNRHVVSSRNHAAHGRYTFNYQWSTLGGPMAPTRSCGFLSKGVYYTDDHFDIVLVELQIDEKIPFVQIGDAAIQKGDRVNVIGHPFGQPKQIAFQNNFVEGVDSTTVEYLAATQPGSSGSPVFNDDWEVVAIHRLGKLIQEPSTKRVVARNTGIKLGPFFMNLPADLRSKLSLAGTFKNPA